MHTYAQGELTGLFWGKLAKPDLENVLGSLLSLKTRSTQQPIPMWLGLNTLSQAQKSTPKSQTWRVGDFSVCRFCGCVPRLLPWVQNSWKCSLKPLEYSVQQSIFNSSIIVSSLCNKTGHKWKVSFSKLSNGKEPWSIPSSGLQFWDSEALVSVLNSAISFCWIDRTSLFLRQISQDKDHC